MDKDRDAAVFKITNIHLFKLVNLIYLLKVLEPVFDELTHHTKTYCSPVLVHLMLSSSTE